MSRVKNITGQKFGSLLVVERHEENNRAGRAQWICQCDCGDKGIYIGKDLRSGNTSSCGCQGSRVTIGDRTRKHGMSNTPTYSTWAAMIKRCTNSNDSRFPYYGGKGISICKAWRSFNEFLKDMGEKPEGKSIDRIDTTGNYCKENCRWASPLEQSNNTTRVYKITYKNETHTISEWSRKLDLPYGTLRRRIVEKKWSPEESFLTPIRELRR